MTQLIVLHLSNGCSVVLTEAAANRWADNPVLSRRIVRAEWL